MKTIAYLTDTHLDETGPGKHGADAHKNWNEILAELAARSTIDQVIFGGDIGAFSAYPQFFESLSGYKNLRVTPGNHDTSAQVRQFFPQDFHPEAFGFYYSEEDQNLKWLFMDSSTDRISAAQLEWLKNQLATTQKEIILFIHHPVLSVDTPIDRKYPLENREAVKDLLLGHLKKVTVFCGHYHIEDEALEKNIRQYVTSAISYQIKKGTVDVEGDASYFGYRMIYIDENAIDTEVVVLYPEDF